MSEEKQVETQQLQSEIPQDSQTTEQEAVSDKVQLTPDQRIEVLQEISVLTGVLNSIRHLPKWDSGNKGKQERKITGSVPLNFFDPQQNAEIATRIIQLINLL
jgi:hypothetical protein